MVFARASLILTNYFLPLNEALCTFILFLTKVVDWMTICTAWIRKVANVEELVFVTDSRLRSFGSWDCNPKIFTFSRTDCVMCFAGDTMFSYPMMIQLKNAVDANEKIRNRRQRLSVFKGVLIKILDGMLEHKSDYEIPDVEFLFGGYCWHEQKFKLWKIIYQKNIKKFTQHIVRWWQGVGSDIKVTFIGDYTDEARDLLIENLKVKNKLKEGGLDFEPFEAIRDLLRDPDAQTKFPAIGGAPQIIKVYKSLNHKAFALKWLYETNEKDQIIEKMTLLGMPIKTNINMFNPVMCADTTKVIKGNMY